MFTNIPNATGSDFIMFDDYRRIEKALIKRSFKVQFKKSRGHSKYKPRKGPIKNLKFNWLNIKMKETKELSNCFKTIS